MFGITSDIDLQKLANDLNLKINSICFKDELPNIPWNGNYIINLASSSDDSGGSHWTGLCLYNEDDIKKAIYFDPFGIYEPQEVTKFIHKWAKEKNIIRSNKDIQNLNSNYCGQYVIACLAELQYFSGKKKKDKLNNFINSFRNYNIN